MRFGTTACGCLLHRILHRLCTGFCTALCSSCEMLVSDLQVVFDRDRLRVADPGTDDVHRVVIGQLPMMLMASQLVPGETTILVCVYGVADGSLNRAVRGQLGAAARSRATRHIVDDGRGS